MKPRRILLVSWAFHPALGGIETSSFLFAKELAERGHAITVVTMTAGMVDGYPFKVVRNPGAATLCNLMKQADLVWHNNISLRFAWPLAVFKRPLIVTHQTWLGTENSGLALAPRLKRALCATAHNVFISQAVDNAAHLPGTIIPNPYDDAVFRLMPEVSRDRDIVFVGRSVKDKGSTARRSATIC